MKGQLFPLGDINPRKGFPYVTISLIAINVIVFIWSLSDFENTINNLGFTPAYPSILTLFTSMFLHGGFDHIFGNMWYLWIFGDNVEDKLGKIKFIFLYIASGLAADFLHFITNLGSDIPSIGASGAISGVLGSYFVLFPKAEVYTRYGRMPSYVVIGLWFVIQFIFGSVSLFGFSGSNVAFFAHVGGFAFGFAFTKLFIKLEK
jgi:membrane associated rhomboid family serine protease